MKLPKVAAAFTSTGRGGVTEGSGRLRPLPGAGRPEPWWASFIPNHRGDRKARQTPHG